MQIGFVYILYSETVDRYYIGSTVDPIRRLFEHSQGKVRATRGKGPWVQLLVQQYPTIMRARQTEYKIKKFKNRAIVERMVQEGEIRLK